MNYRIEGNSVYANDGYVFRSKSEHNFMVKCMDVRLLDLYDCVPEPEPVEEEQEVEDNGESDVSV